MKNDSKIMYSRFCYIQVNIFYFFQNFEEFQKMRQSLARQSLADDCIFIACLIRKLTFNIRRGNYLSMC